MQNKSYNVDVFSISSVQVWVGNILIRTHMPADLAEKNWTGPFLELTDKAVWKLLPEKKSAQFQVSIVNKFLSLVRRGSLSIWNNILLEIIAQIISLVIILSCYCCAS